MVVPEARDVIVGRDWLVARFPLVRCTYIGPYLDDSDFFALADEIAREIDARAPDERIGVLQYTPESGVMDSPRRRHIAKLLNEREEKLRQTTAAYALATHSTFVRGVVTTLSWMAPPGYPHAAVASPEQGLAFIATHLPECAPDQIARSFAALIDARLRRAS
ncbi:hypothetical protein PPSIR1_23026 [Plesiocystis pacifica SIR-1]|uniref:Uncharacterized protein n=1 Tax=Plesiocystis pacifica SIR-1 TaxID=391625 RepID=A6G2M8_9BACT|nr:hypothetical protein [Plesiocystis pacifica]EDM79965.1 hypothetical protein PPSIR1_23026 [Plesiocystis pacifica SIR-1]